jgi:hypothetical protein
VIFLYYIGMRPDSRSLRGDEEEEDGGRGGGGERQGSSPAQFHQAMMCTRQAGKAIIRVVGRCDQAKENEMLGKKKNHEK